MYGDEATRDRILQTLGRRAGTCSFTGTAAAFSTRKAGLVEVDFQKELRRVRNLTEEDK